MGLTITNVAMNSLEVSWVKRPLSWTAEASTLKFPEQLSPRISTVVSYKFLETTQTIYGLKPSGHTKLEQALPFTSSTFFNF